MNIILNINDIYDADNSSIIKHNFIFLDKKRNIIMDGEFTKIIFSNEHITMNGIYTMCPMQFQAINDRTGLNKNILYFQPYHALNVPLLNIFSEIEKQILRYYKEYYTSSKTPLYSLHNQLHSGNVKIYKSYNEQSISPPPGFAPIMKKYVIKMSGIWETDRNIGITYKFLELKSSRDRVFTTDE